MHKKQGRRSKAHIPLLREELDRQAEEIRRLRQAIDHLLDASSALFGSLTWRFGSYIARVLRKLPFVAKGPLAGDTIRHWEAEYRKWTELREADEIFRGEDLERAIPQGPEETLDVFEEKVVSVIIPTLDGEDELRGLLLALNSQEGFKKIEVIVVDSGSRDGTVALAGSMGAEVVEIQQAEFSHSYARNKGAECAGGDLLLFTTQDALPTHDRWLVELAAAMRRNHAVAASCAEFPREDADLFFQVIIWVHNRFLGLDKGDRVFRKPDVMNHESIRKNAHLTDVANLIDRSIFEKYRFNRNFAEDLDLGVRLVMDGHRIAFLGSTKVIHSHNRSPFYYLKRGYAQAELENDIFNDLSYDCSSLNDLFSNMLFFIYKIDDLYSSIFNDVKLHDNIKELKLYIEKKLYDSDYREKSDINFDIYDEQFEEMVKFIISNISNENSKDKVIDDFMYIYTNSVYGYLERLNIEFNETFIRNLMEYFAKSLGYAVGLHLFDACNRSPANEKDLFEPILRQLEKGV